MMLRGIKIDTAQRAALSLELLELKGNYEKFFVHVLGHELNPRSPKQMQELFYGDFGQKPVFSRKTGTITVDDEALQKIAQREPLLLPLTNAIGNYRSVGVFLSTFVGAELDSDGRMRSSFNIDGTVTTRFSSSEDAFGSGMNLENIPSEKSKSIAKAKKRGGLELPNLRTMFVPDPSMEIFDADLDRADLQVVVWECEDSTLKAMLREGVDLHKENARVLFNLASVANVTPSQREFVKTFVHGTNYGGGPKTMAANSNCTIHEAERFQDRWFSEHPGIRQWHRRVEMQLQTTRTVSNKFGYQRYFFDRVEGLLPEALGWIPQSTVAAVINRGLVRIDEDLDDVQMLIQVHDSVVGQYPTHLRDRLQPLIRERLLIEVPYDDPLIIPIGMKTSTKSWGDCK
jgi:DNA polymerase-1